MNISKEERERLMNAGAQAWYALRVLHVKLHEDATQPPDEIQELFSACVERITELQAENQCQKMALAEIGGFAHLILDDYYSDSRADLAAHMVSLQRHLYRAGFPVYDPDAEEGE